MLLIRTNSPFYTNREKNLKDKNMTRKVLHCAFCLLSFLNYFTLSLQYLESDTVGWGLVQENQKVTLVMLLSKRGKWEK